MSSGTKINQLLQEVPGGTVLLSSWLSSKGYPYELQQRYRKSGWLTAIGIGAMKRSGDRLTLTGAIYTLQHQAGLQIHVGGRTALGMHGLAHYLELNPQETFLFAPRGVKLPAWLKNNTWNTNPVLINTSFLPPETGLTDFSEEGLSIKISSPVRAMMECLEMSPDNFSLEEAYQIMESLSFVRPDAVQSLLEQCTSVKVTRLFMFLAQKAGHQWMKKIETRKIKLGKGKRVIARDGAFESEFQITVPKNLL
ncbi:MAG: type IV toxin-antitoxin system AbiEi family antitoxin [Bacteroidales bacterium]